VIHPPGAEEPTHPASVPLLLYDGACGLCAASVQFVLDHERAPVLQFAPLAGPTAAGIRARHPWLDDVDSLVLIEGPRVHVRSTAALGVTRYLRWPWPLLRVAGIVPHRLRDWSYGLIARHRHRVGGVACVLPPPEARSRFLP